MSDAPQSPARPRSCPICGTADTQDLGPVAHPEPPTVAGVDIDLSGLDFRLRGCEACGFQFKDPPIPAARLQACYEQASADHWQASPDPRKRRFDVLAALLDEHAAGRRILDVGCFNGAVLEYLGDGWQRFGIEPSRAAADLARQRGVQVLATTLDELSEDAGLFDVVVALDVVEHLTDPLPLFRRAADLLTPGGVLVIGTGDTGSWPFRLHGSRYWYVSLPEHVSFFDERSMNRVATEVQLVPIEHRRLSHIRADPVHRGRQAMRNLSYAAARRAGGFGVPALKRYVDGRAAPGWLTARDHMLHVMGRRAGLAGR